VAPDVSAAAVVCSVVVGITTSLILFCSHFHQIADDKAANKMSPLVRLGTANGVKVSTHLHHKVCIFTVPAADLVADWRSHVVQASCNSCIVDM